ncbi:MAG: alpha-amylase family glycosyl hydrolase [Flavobacteriaceae bacterium]|jgi:alpha-amylase|nr:alpha-amylase family glycosyl hydrolase [Flavobacteriaceae bacterium]MDO7582089.1 alpha-amylase family glycosyl hydrolase [Flavobacteriaceae bacterium]MDO7592292.1 alpha-amylase family glycosyl hydrolase [Flavobacteriaceae bacterium]MDO7598980.1 alpha-amylase family glycosyl hydrolase [Flavobacteriaceae bacterium]MDO7603791.1 alpha-amylase family glycosyl hydrolase [Flavobacteriaceae bacterium]
MRFISLLLLLTLIFCSKEATGTSDRISETTINLDNIETDPWWNDAVFYEIFVRSFYDSNADGVGDLQGIIQKLDYLNDGNPNTDTDLGITALWLMPIFPSPSYHGYDVTDYRNIDEEYGTMNDFKALITAAHARGIKIVIDFVGNHTSDQHPWFTASASNESKRDWYLWNSNKPSYNGPWGQEVWHERNSSYYYGVFWGGMPDLNYTNQEVTNEIKNTLRFWKEEVGVDGFRIDAVKHWIENGDQQENTAATLAWWRDLYVFQKSLDPGLMMVGEAWTSTQNIAPYSDKRLDYCFEFDLSYALIDGINNQTNSGLKSKMSEIISTYETNQYGTFLTNHDQDRSFYRFGMDERKAKLAARILLSLPGVPYIYYGEEVGMLGQKPDEDIRRPMQWTSSANAGFSSTQPWHPLNNNYVNYNVANQQLESESIWSQYQIWIKQRTRNTALRSGNYDFIESNNSRMFSYLRADSESNTAFAVIHNLSSQNTDDITIRINNSSLTEGTYNLINILNNQNMGSINVSSSGAFDTTLSEVTLAAYSSFLLKLEGS